MARTVADIIISTLDSLSKWEEKQIISFRVAGRFDGPDYD